MRLRMPKLDAAAEPDVDGSTLLTTRSNATESRGPKGRRPYGVGKEFKP